MDNTYNRERIRKKWKKPDVVELPIKNTLGGQAPGTYENTTFNFQS